MDHCRDAISFFSEGQTQRIKKNKKNMVLVPGTFPGMGTTAMTVERRAPVLLVVLSPFGEKFHIQEPGKDDHRHGLNKSFGAPDLRTHERKDV